MQASSEVGHLISDVRGLGLMVGVEFNAPTPAFGRNLAEAASSSDNAALGGKTPPSKLASRVAKKCMDAGMFILTTSGARYAFRPWCAC